MAGLYIHVPFCHSKCWYCDFYSLTRPELESRYIDALKREMDFRHAEVDQIKTIYIGGGTPSSLSVDAVKELGKILPAEAVDEFTVEFNPEDVSDEVCRAWRDIGANRVSMGVQSLNDDELRAVGRRHDAATAIRAYQTLRRHFDNVSLDLILALPGQNLQTLETTLNCLLDLQPEHFSAYILSYEPRTRLWAQRLANKITETDEDTQIKMYHLLCSEARRRGYEHYEISNFAIPGYRARHNSAYWTNTPYLGLGPAAHSFDGFVRRENPRDFEQWAGSIDKRGYAYTVEDESIADRVNDRIMVALRTADGLDIDSIPPLYRDEILKNARRLGPARITVGQRLIIPEDAWLVSDDTISELFV